jgi:MFS family permease
VFSGVTGLALITGPVLGGAIASGLTWQWIFWLNLPIGLVALLLVRSRIAESAEVDTAFDFGGLALVTGAVLGIAWALMRANVAGWDRPDVVALLVIGVVLALGFVGYERRIQEPMVPIRLFASRDFVAGNASSFFLYASMYGVVFFLPQFLQVAQGNDALGAGLRLLPWTATLFVFAPIGGALVNRTGEKPLVVCGIMLQALGFAWIAFEAAPDLQYARLVAPLLVAGAGVSLAMPAAQNAVLGAVAPADIGKASGIFNMLRFLGGVFGIAIQGAAFVMSGGFDTAASLGAGFTAAIGVAAALSLGGALIGLGLAARGTSCAGTGGREELTFSVKEIGR